MVFADTMLMADGAAGVDNGSAGRLFYGFPGLQRCLRPVIQAEKKGGINTGAGRINVRKMSKHMDPLVPDSQSVCDGFFYGVHGGGYFIPGDGRFQSVHSIAQIPERVSQVSGSETVLSQALPMAFPTAMPLF